MSSVDSEITNPHSGFLEIKPEYVVTGLVRATKIEGTKKNDEDSKMEETEELPSKKMKFTKPEKKVKGQNKNRGITYRVERETEFCPHLMDTKVGEEKSCQMSTNCVFKHDYKAYLNDKMKDIGETCYIYTVKGHCPRGITCRFGSQHLTPNGRNIVNNEVLARLQNGKSKTVFNDFSKDLQLALRKKKYNFKKSEDFVKLVDKACGRNNLNSEGGEIKLRTEEKKKIEWKDKLYLAPLTTVGNLPFRRICKEFGADITCGEMAMASSLLQGRFPEWALVKRHESEDLFGVQLCGGNMPMMARCAQLLQESTNIDFIDINMGCPLDFVYEQGCGSGLMSRRRPLEAIVKCLGGFLDIPLTVKLRTGVTSQKNIAHTLMPMFRDAGVSLVTVHGRSREQRYIRSADWDYIEQCAKVATPLPVFGNGDILSFVDYEALRAKAPSAAGVMIGRGALIKPWIFQEIKERRHLDLKSSERLEILKKYVNYGLDHWGSDTRGVETCRRFLLEWLSFLYRYVPVGLLQSPPQRMNQRPPFYKGRDDLETLMASPNCADWIKISELLLGPVPDGFVFLPKHKANSWG